MGTKCIWATSFSSGKPLADGWSRDAKSLGNGSLRPAFMLELSARVRRHSFQSRNVERVVSIPHSTANS